MDPVTSHTVLDDARMRLATHVPVSAVCTTTEVPERSRFHLGGQSGGSRVCFRISLSGYMRFAKYVHVCGFLALPCTVFARGTVSLQQD